MELIAVVMACETSQKRAAACRSMLDYGFANYSVISPDLEEAAQVPVILGTADSVPLTLASGESMLIDKGQKNSISYEVTPEPSVKAPVVKGQTLGSLTVKAGDQVLKTIPLVASENVDRLTWGNLFLIVLRRAAMGKTV